MASSPVETLRPDLPQAAPRPPEAAVTAAGKVPPPPTADTAAPEAPPRLGAFRSGRGDDRLTDLLAYAMAVEAHEAAAAKGEAAAPLAAPEAAERWRDRATRELHDHAFRLLHNRVEEIRAEAVAEHLGRHPRPPGLAMLVLANLLALGLAAVAAAWLHGNPQVLARILAAFGS
ncbi:hypothetical protein GCM10010964_11890 [Caldovatus sediminis]|uniref:Uncharacterized protein n=1 Tax=Caldovatus sediminis TaxID=2041189 RepID=A0A8J2Z9M6_9PROT|nr:hypothetical protein [Caldovatus sediminis]GGG25552.1 hypothetical protein GCM10010964_11890 [Caldovatus sediminis]